MENNNKIMPFGKYKGEEIVEIASKDPNYIEWLKNQNWLNSDFKQQIINININNIDKKQDSPEHNKLQYDFYKKIDLFLEKQKEREKLKYDFIKINKKELEYVTINNNYIDVYIDVFYSKKNERIYRFIKEKDLQGKYISPYIDQFNIKEHKDFFIKDTIDNANKIEEKCFMVCKYSNENNTFELTDWCDNDDFIEERVHYIIEIKPSLNDDFFSYIRQIEKYKKDIESKEYNKPYTHFRRIKLIIMYQNYNISNLDKKEVKEIFSNKGIDLIRLEGGEKND